MSDVALGLLAEIERLRKELDYLNNQRRLDNEEAARLYDFARDKGRALERDDVVAWLRQEFDTDSVRIAADEIERGEHRTKEKP